MKDLEHIKHMKHMKDMKDMAHMEHMKHMKHMKDMKDMEHMKHMKHMQHMKEMEDLKHKKVTVAKGVKESKEERDSLRKKEGSSNEGKYKHVSPKDFAGKEGGASPHSYPINTKKRAKAALAYAHNAPRPEGIKKAVHKKYPSLDRQK